MAVIETVCQGVNWQEDFTPLVPRLYRYFWRCFKHRREQPELAHRAVCFFMKRFMNGWQPGKTVRIATSFIVWHILAGRDLLPRETHVKSVETVRLTPGVSRRYGKRDRIIEHLNYKECLALVNAFDRKVVKLFFQSYKLNTIAKKLGVQWEKVRQALRRFAELLNC